MQSVQKMRFLLERGGPLGVLVVGAYLLFRSRRARTIGIAAFAAASLLRMAGCPQAPPLYRITDLGTLPGTAESGATDINARGQVVGWSGTRPNKLRPFLWERGQMRELPALKGASYSAVAAVNERGQAVGWSGSLYGQHHPVLWERDGRTPRDLGALPDKNAGEAKDINRKGEVVGLSFRHTKEGKTLDRAFLWSEKAGMRDLGALPGDPDDDESGAEAISDSGYIAGWSRWYNFFNAFVRAPGADSLTRLKRLPGGKWVVRANAVNRSGQVVGVFDATERRFAPHACLWPRPDQAVDLGAIGGRKEDLSAARDINDRGSIVGWSTIPGRDRFETNAVLWQNRKLSDLNDLIPKDSGWTLQTASAISSRGWIVGTGVIHGKTHAFLLVPA